ncbi:hypothetical protein Pelo_1298 [Pelomyxa schiedti]|nr:hypothetical protein Pelo_1298 [Pelomyxa schiedti]
MSEKVNNEGMTEEESAERTPEESETAGLEKPAEKEREEVEPRGHGKKRHHSSHHKKGKKHHHKGAEHAGDKKKAHHSHHKKSKGHHKARTEVEQVGHKKKRHHRHHHKKSHSHEKGRDPANEAADPKTADEADDEAEENEPPAEPPVEPPVEATVARPPKAKRAASNKAREDVRAAPKPPPVAEPGWPPGWLVQPPPHYIWEPSFIKFRTIDHVPHSGPRIFNTPDHFVLSGATSPVDWTIGNIITDNGTVLRRITELGPHHLWVVSQDRASPKT